MNLPLCPAPIVLRNLYRALTGCVAASLLALSATAWAADAAALSEAAKVEWQWGVKIPLRDGVHLNATLYRPAGEKTPRPCLFTLTPYISQSYHDRGMYFAAHGYPFLTIDVRGRGNSEGEYHPLIQEAKDGYDIVEWLARQPYCNGKISMWGGSYAGYDQWATAKEFPPHLATIVPVASPLAGVDFPARNNVFGPYDIQWLTFTSGHTSQDHLFADDAFWTGMWRRWLESGSPFRGLDGFLGNPSAIYQEWVNHPDVDDYWESYNPSSEQYARMSIPILTITGMYDDDQPGALAHYRRYMSAAAPAARARHFLIIGPWDHPGTRTPKREFGGMKFGEASLVDLPQLHLDWYRFAMEGGSRPEFLHKQVAYYVTGAEHWRYADSLESITAESKPYYLDSRGDGAQTEYSSGRLIPDRVGGGAPDHYKYDPRDLSLLAVEAQSDSDSQLDQALFRANSAQVIYISQPYAQASELSGFLRLEAWISIDQPDTDFVASVSEITPDGTVIPLSSDVMRARYRESPRVQKLVTSKAPQRYEFNRFTFASRMLQEGSRIRLAISAANSMLYEKNYNSGKVVADETLRDAHTVQVTVLHDFKHPSALYIPYATH